MSQIVLCSLPASPFDDLHWEKEIKEAKDHILASNRLVWEIDFSFSKLEWIPEDSALFFSLVVAVEEFTKKVLPEFYSETAGVILYQGNGDFQQGYPLSYWESSFEAWAEDLKLPVKDYSLFTTQLTAEWLQRLVSFFPEELKVGIVVEPFPQISRAKKEQLFSKERFCSIEVLSCFQDWEREKEIPSLGVCLPQDRFFTHRLREELEQLFAALKGKQFRVIPEGIVTQEWEGLDELIVIVDALSHEGKRKLAGFQAAGGIVIEAGSLIRPLAKS